MHSQQGTKCSTLCIKRYIPILVPLEKSFRLSVYVPGPTNVCTGGTRERCNMHLGKSTLVAFSPSCNSNPFPKPQITHFSLYPWNMSNEYNNQDNQYNNNNHGTSSNGGGEVGPESTTLPPTALSVKSDAQSTSHHPPQELLFRHRPFPFPASLLQERSLKRARTVALQQLAQVHVDPPAHICGLEVPTKTIGACGACGRTEEDPSNAIVLCDGEGYVLFISTGSALSLSSSSSWNLSSRRKRMGCTSEHLENAVAPCASHMLLSLPYPVVAKNFT